MKQGLVSVVIPVYNRKGDLEKCLNSLSQQDYREIEIIVVDDSSSDDTCGFLKANYPQVKVLRNNTHMGPSSLRNQGIVASQGEYILFLDSDTEFITKDTIANMVEMFNRNRDYGSVGGELAIERGSIVGARGRRTGFDGTTTPVLSSKDDNTLLICDYLASCNCMASRNLLYQIGGFDPYWGFGGEDTDLGFRIIQKGYKNVASFRVSVLHKRSPRGRMPSETYLYHRSRVRFVLKNFGVGRFFIVLAIDIFRILGFYLVFPVKLALKLLLRQKIKKENFTGGLLIAGAYLWNIFNFYETLRARDKDFLSSLEMRRYEEYHLRRSRFTCHIGLRRLIPKVIYKIKDFVFVVLAKFPRSLQLAVCRVYIANKKKYLHKLTTPNTLIFFVTNRCNLRCRHCFFWEDINLACSELTLEEIEKIAASLHYPVYLSLTGGEPFLRPDLAQICLLFNRLNHTQEIGIATNGLMTEEIGQACEYILSYSSIRKLGIQVSLDGLPDTHDEIRGLKGAFQKAITTLQSLKELQKKFPQLEVVVGYTIQKNNLQETEEFIKFMLAFRVPIRFNIIRGSSFGTYGLPLEASSGIDPRQADSVSVPLELLEAAFEKIWRLNEESDFKFCVDFQNERIRISLDTLRTGKRQIPCYAGKIEAVLYANGEVAMCELSRPFGNLRDFDYDFSKLWNSPAASQMRRLIQNCFCIHGCNLTTSLAFKPEILAAKIFKK